MRAAYSKPPDEASETHRGHRISLDVRRCFFNAVHNSADYGRKVLSTEVASASHESRDWPRFFWGYLSKHFGQTTWIYSIKTRLDQLKELQPGWDQEAAPAIDRECLSAAERVAESLVGYISKPPKVVPLPEGTVQLEWRQGRKLLEIELENANTIHFLKWYPDDGIRDEDIIPISDHDSLVSLVNWFEGH